MTVERFILRNPLRDACFASGRDLMRVAHDARIAASADTRRVFLLPKILSNSRINTSAASIYRAISRIPFIRSIASLSRTQDAMRARRILPASCNLIINTSVYLPRPL